VLRISIGGLELWLGGLSPVAPGLSRCRSRTS